MYENDFNVGRLTRLHWWMEEHPWTVWSGIIVTLIIFLSVTS